MKIWQPFKTGLSLSYLFTVRCRLCRSTRLCNTSTNQSSTELSQVLCTNCSVSINLLPKPGQVTLSNNQILTIQAVAEYVFPVSNIIKRFKLQNDILMLPILKALIYTLPIPSNLSIVDTIIIPTPTANRRLKDRGFDPVWVLATYLSEHYQVVLWQNISIKDRKNQQKELSRNQRFENMKDVFNLELEIPGHVKNIILFDDISTTGASFLALAEAVLSATDQEVRINALCVAH